tara:strand:- start:8855 stop:9898 length:1044 start_codon:yes stop_codon:yes gene_type:complete
MRPGPNYTDLNRIYEGFNEAYSSEPERYAVLSFQSSGDVHNGIRLDLNDEMAKGYWELLRPHRDLLICIADGMYHADYRQTILPRRDIISLRFLLSGSLAFTFDKLGKVDVPQASVSVLYTPEDNPFDLFIDRGSHLCSVTLHLHPDMLRNHFGLDRRRIPASLEDVIYGGKLDKNLYNLPLSAATMNIVLSMMNAPYQGMRKRIVAEAKTAELICRLFQEIEESANAGFRSLASENSPNISLKQKLFTAQKILIEKHQNPPTLASLAREVGLNRNTLSAEFKRLFGHTVFEFCQAYRMNKAREFLQDRSLSISQVAERVGYEHPTNFTSAFKKHYGVLPKAMRLTD